MTSRSRDVTRFIRRYTLRYGFAPTVREIQRALRLSSTSVAHYHIRGAIDGGLVTNRPKEARTLQVTRRGEREIDEH